MTAETNIRLLGLAEFGATAVIEDNLSCNATTGLSPTSLAAHVLGRFSKLTSLNHPNLCKYVEFVRSTILGNAGFLISEHYSWSVVEELKECKKLDVKRIISLLQPVLSAFSYLHSRHIIIGYFSLNSILLSPQNLIRLAQYGLNCISGSRRDVEYCIYSSWHLPPERFLLAETKNGFICRAGDIWSFGIAVFEITVVERSGSIFQLLLAEIQQKKPNIHIESNEAIMMILEKALCILPSQRPTARELLFIIDDANKSYSNVSNGYSIYDSGNDESSLGEDAKHMKELLEDERAETTRNLPVNEAFLWKLCGSSVETILINQGIIKANPSVIALPYLVNGDCFMYGNADVRKYELTFDIFSLPSNNFRDRMKSLNENKFLISFEMEGKTREIYDLSLMVKEKDIEYQLSLQKSLLFCECCHDIPPLYRANLWSALLNIYWDVEKHFIAVDTFSPHVSDRQLLYDDLMASPIAHHKLKRLLKAWLLLHENYVYWQGLDSLAAPFLVLNFTHLAGAYSCLESFVSLYLHDFFLQDNSSVVQDLPGLFHHELQESYCCAIDFYRYSLVDLNMERLVQYSVTYYNTVPASCTFRRYASKHVREEYAMTHYTATELNEFCCPRISAADIVRLTEHSSLLVVDVRPQYEYSRGAIVGSVNLPPYGEEDTLDTIKTALVNAQSAGHVTVIVDNEHLQRAKKISKLCVLEGYNRVCVLDGGVQKVRSMHHIFAYLLESRIILQITSSM
ncbi:TBC domain-containing protein kinase-like protein [Dirofilaria immitis]|nr:TBC domain-containing protein kinase-like protein [Dirofilaria immitis]